MFRVLKVFQFFTNPWLVDHKKWCFGYEMATDMCRGGHGGPPLINSMLCFCLFFSRKSHVVIYCSKPFATVTTGGGLFTNSPPPPPCFSPIWLTYYWSSCSKNFHCPANSAHPAIAFALIEPALVFSFEQCAARPRLLCKEWHCFSLQQCLPVRRWVWLCGCPWLTVLWPRVATPGGALIWHALFSHQNPMAPCDWMVSFLFYVTVGLKGCVCLSDPATQGIESKSV